MYNIRKITMYLPCLCAVLIVAVSGQREGEQCVDRYANIAGTCRAVEQCQSAQHDHQQGLIQPTFCSDNAYGGRVVCCRDGSNILQAAYPVRDGDDRPIWGVANQRDTRRVSERKCEEYSRGVMQQVEYIPLIPDPETLTITTAKCDYNSVELIIGGVRAEPGEFPHMAALGWVGLTGEHVFKCGGSLISHRYVLTAAHCAQDRELGAQPVIVRLGDQNIDNRVRDGASPIDVPIRRLHRHPNYKPPAKYDDIMLLELATDVAFKSDLRAACLWTRPDFGEYRNVVATGWGIYDSQTRATSNELQKVSLSLLDNQYCDTLLVKNQNRNWNGFASSQMCAGELRGGKDTCQGDSGSPIQVASRDNHCIFHIVGVTSFGKYCAQSGIPGIYTRVSSYLDWIESIVWPGE